MANPLSAPLLSFLRDLRANNDRDWFEANRARYTADVEAPALDFIRAVQDPLARISDQFAASARRKGGSLGSLEASSRFAEAPYRPYLVFRFAHRARKVTPPPMFYLRLSAEGGVGGGGMYHPSTESLAAIRQAINANRVEWTTVLATAPVVHGESLTRTPRDYPADHPFANDLKRKGHVVMTSYSVADVTADGFLDRFVTTCESATPFRAVSDARGRSTLVISCPSSESGSSTAPRTSRPP